ncbi:MAG: cytochrome c biogenesis CcdA family protein, partial [Sphingomicrobium sp.]
LFRTIGGVLLVVLGAVLLVRAAESGLGASLGLVSRWANGRLDHFAGDSLPGQAVVGALLGLVWVPCIGPTLGAASMLAAQKESLDQVALVMMSFGIGAAVPLAAIGGLSGRLRVPLTGALRRLWTAGKPLLGTMLVAVGVLVVSGLDRSLEASLTAAAPDWLIALTTRY